MMQRNNNPQSARTRMQDSHRRDHYEPREQSPAAEQIPEGNRVQLLNYLNEVSFAAYDALLYLDTHCSDPAALASFRRNNALRRRAAAAYARNYGPLTLDAVEDSGSDRWEWTMQPWPWESEGGGC